ncbi:hypothetical protein [Chenggangzhangella methanolivorans]|uniref:Uncharacterized protein n=1 Tax=Chenggangzhangella methanolivorans TaxID=1437009 RepID=A0A9E6ULD1_9HYPH|nr:hypothetical protein [Chenggangzhangella methanolivorans]QZN98800.1 hypothetical protein K6K41_17870 [Chenggangzhangella methanolivorans]
MTDPALRGRLALAALLFAASPASGAEPVRLITAEEAALPPVVASGGQPRNMTRGPGIDRIAPAMVGLKGEPFRFAVKFKPRNGVPIDPASVRVTYQRAPSVDLSPRLKPFVTADGIEAAAVVVPPGAHVIEIEATDLQGRVGRAQVTLTVDPPK